MGHQADAGRQPGKPVEPPSDEEWRRAAATIARYLPGLGSPMDLTLDEIRDWMDALNAILRDEQPGMDPAADHRARVEAEMRRLHG
jgi:hypothetical protein